MDFRKDEKWGAYATKEHLIIMPEFKYPPKFEERLSTGRESISQYEAAARKDLADGERFEVKVLSDYLPQQLSEAEVAEAIAAALAESGAAGVKDMGKVMALLRPRLAGRADMGKVSGLVKARLSA